LADADGGGSSAEVSAAGCLGRRGVVGDTDERACDLTNFVAVLRYPNLLNDLGEGVERRRRKNRRRK
jgi:hypothetical protein